MPLRFERNGPRPANAVAVLLAPTLAGLLACCACGTPRANEPEQATQGSGAPLSEGARCMEDARVVPDSRPGMPLKIEVSHILVRHAELDDPRGATRTPEQACLRALEALHALEAGGDWAETVKRFSDSPNSSELGRVAPDDLAPGFSETAFTLDINQLSYVVESPRGYHVILRTR